MINELIITGIMIPVASAFIWMLKNMWHAQREHEKWLAGELKKQQAINVELTNTLRNHFKTDEHLQRAHVDALQDVAHEIRELKRIQA